MLPIDSSWAIQTVLTWMCVPVLVLLKLLEVCVYADGSSRASIARFVHVEQLVDRDSSQQGAHKQSCTQDGIWQEPLGRNRPGLQSAACAPHAAITSAPLRCWVRRSLQSMIRSSLASSSTSLHPACCYVSWQHYVCVRAEVTRAADGGKGQAGLQLEVFIPVYAAISHILQGGRRLHWTQSKLVLDCGLRTSWQSAESCLGTFT